MTRPASSYSDSSPPPPKSFLTNAAALVAAAAFSQVISFAAMLVVARLYGPFEVGVFGLFNAAFTLAVLAASWRYEVAVVTVETDDEANDIALFIIVAGLASATVASIALLLIEMLPGGAGISSSLRRALIGLPLSLVLASAILAGTNICIRERRFGRVALHQIVLTVVTAAAQILLADVEMPGSRLVVGFLLGQFVGLAVLVSPLTRALARSARMPGLAERLIVVARRHSGHFFYTVPYSLVAQFYYQLPLMLLGVMFSTKEVGFFSLAFRTTFTPITLIPTALAQVFFPEMARDKDRLGHWEARLLTLLVALGIGLAPAVAALIVIGPDIYAVVLGEGWRHAGLFAQLMIFANLMNGLATGYDRIYFVLHRQSTALAVISSIVAVSVLFMLAAEWLGGGPAWLVGGWSAGHLVLALAWMITIYQIAGFSLRALLGRWAVIAATTAALAVGMMLSARALQGEALAVLVVLAVAVAYCIAAILTLRPLKMLVARGGGLN